MLVFTMPGHSTDTPIADPSSASSWCNVSEMATTANLDAWYAPSPGTVIIPAMDAVFTM